MRVRVRSNATLLLAFLSAAGALQVFDNVILKKTREGLHLVASEGGLSHRLLDRSRPPSSPLERALVEILDEMDDFSPYVEYWCRQEWRHIEAHADVDEFLAKSGRKQFRYPIHGHVLYLQLGEHVKGPTCIFEECVSGGDLVAKSDVSLVTIPAVEGRLLRFPGNLLHAVPRPTDIWLLPFVQGSPDFNPKLFERSVVLFNTWQEPPLDVPKLEEKLECLSQEISVVPRSDWDKVPIIERVASDVEGSSTRAKIWLLGDLTRRNHTMRTVHLYAKQEELRDALEQPEKPYRTIFHAV